MNEGRVTRMVRELSLALVIATALLGQPAQAQEREEVAIASARADLNAAVLHLEGRNFLHAGTHPLVHLNGMEKALHLVRVTNESITASLPAHLQWGSYVVRVRRGAAGPSCEKAIELGIVGPVVQDN